MLFIGIIICAAFILLVLVGIVIYSMEKESSVPVLPVVDYRPPYAPFKTPQRKTSTKSRQLCQQKKKVTIYPHGSPASSV